MLYDKCFWTRNPVIKICELENKQNESNYIKQQVQGFLMIMIAKWNERD